MKQNMRIETTCIHGFKDKSNNTGAIAVPIFQSATFSHSSLNETTEYSYSRLQNPTRDAVEKVVAQLENAGEALAFTSGMAATSALMELFEIGDHIIAIEDLYGGSIRLFNNITRKNGIEVDYVNNSVSDICAKIKSNTKAIFIETPTNPMMHVTDIGAVKEAISKRSNEKNILIIVDNTFLTPYFQQPLSLGADIIIHSGTKYLGGHNDTLAGFLVASDPDLIERLRFIHKTTGACLSPMDSFLIIRGIKTLAIRMEKAQHNAMILASWLQGQKSVKAVYYVGLKDHKDYEISKKQARGFGAMISFEVDSKETARKILEGVSLITYAESLGGTETLITYPMLQTHGDVPIEEREARGINERLLRISIGIEHIDDIIEDLAKAIGN